MIVFVRFLLALVCVGQALASLDDIEHFVVLMLENRSFDHMLGWLKEDGWITDPRFEGLDSNMFNLFNNSDPSMGQANATYGSDYVATEDPCHGVTCVTWQVFGQATADLSMDPPPMNGFVEDLLLQEDNIYSAPEVMAAFTPDQVPAMTNMAVEFALGNKWYADVPGPTEVNRMYLYSGTSHGMGSNTRDTLIKGLPQDPIWLHLFENNVTSKVYFEEVPSVLFLQKMRTLPLADLFAVYDDFLDDARDGTLPQYSFIEPFYYAFEDIPANDMHPAHSVLIGQDHVAKVYEAVRNGPLWNKTAFILTYDEHGGYFDHVPTKLKGIPNPDGLNSTDPPFGFDRLGVRVPTIIASPWIPRRTILEAGNGPTDTSEYSHSSIPATLKRKFGLPEFLTDRTKWASTFDLLFDDLDEPRTDCPTTLPILATDDYKKERGKIEHTQPLGEMHFELVRLAAHLDGCIEDAEQVKTERDASIFTRDRIGRYLKLDTMRRLRNWAKENDRRDVLEELENPFPSKCDHRRRDGR